MTIADPINQLRLALAEAGSPTLSAAESEAWAKLERWRAASEGLPLMLGVSPTAWPGICARPGCAPLVDAVWAAFATALHLIAGFSLGVDIGRNRPVLKVTGHKGNVRSVCCA